MLCNDTVRCGEVLCVVLYHHRPHPDLKSAEDDLHVSAEEFQRLIARVLYIARDDH